MQWLSTFVVGALAADGRALRALRARGR